MIDELEIVKCAYCNNLTARANLQGCVVCETFDNACVPCWERHQQTHTPEEARAVEAELLA